MNRRISGFAIVNAIFLILVLGALAAAMVTLSKVESDTSTKSLQAVRVYYGAEAGLEWGIQRAIAAGEAACTAANTSFTLTQGILNGIRVTVTCNPDRQGSAPPTNMIYTITSCATTDAAGCAAPTTLANSNYAERRLAATVSTLP